MQTKNEQATIQGAFFIGWKNHKRLKKRLTEPSFSWSGLMLSLSVAFVLVLATASLLNYAHNSIKTANLHETNSVLVTYNK